MNFEAPKKISSIDKVRNLAKKGMMLARLGTALLSSEGCKDKDEGSQSKMPPKGPDPIVENVGTKKVEHKFLSADEVVTREKMADDVVIGYLEKLSNNNSTGDRMEMNDRGNIFVEIHGSFFDLSESDLLRLRSIVMGSELPQNASRSVRTTAAQALETKIDLDIFTHGKKVTDPSILPSKIKAHYNDLKSIGR